jgi:hypothetical protein
MLTTLGCRTARISSNVLASALWARMVADGRYRQW